MALRLQVYWEKVKFSSSIGGCPQTLVEGCTLPHASGVCQPLVVKLGAGFLRAHPESAGISASRPEISRRASAQRDVESAIMEKLYPWSLQYSAKVMPVYMDASRAATGMLLVLATWREEVLLPAGSFDCDRQSTLLPKEQPLLWAPVSNLESCLRVYMGGGHRRGRMSVLDLQSKYLRGFHGPASRARICTS